MRKVEPMVEAAYFFFFTMQPYATSKYVHMAMYRQQYTVYSAHALTFFV